MTGLSHFALKTAFTLYRCAVPHCLADPFLPGRCIAASGNSEVTVM